MYGNVMCHCSIEGKIVRGSGAEVVRGHGFAAPPPGHQQHGHNPLLLQQQSPQRQQQAVSQYEETRKPIKERLGSCS